MPQSNVGIRFNIDVSEGKSHINELSNSVKELRDRIAEATRDAETTGNWDVVNKLYSSLNDATSARSQIMQQIRQAENDDAIQNKKSGGIFGGESSDFGKYLLTQSLMKLTDTVISALEKGFKAAEQRASGDYAGAHISGMEQTGGLISGVSGLVASIVGLIASGGNAAVASIAGQLVEKIAGYFTGEDISKERQALAYSAQYKKILPDIDTLNQLYGVDINRKSLEDNNAQGLAMYGRATDAAAGTGLTTEQFINAMKQVGGYGIDNETKALNMAKNQALWARFTGADLSAIQKYAGQAYRYNGETNAAATAYGGLMAQNMGKGQMTEYLTAMGRVMEESISKGFVKSSEEIAGNMVMLYKLSGESSLWQGEQGAQRLTQMNNAIANSTNLQSVEDVINFSVAKDMFKGLNEQQAKELLTGADGKNGAVHTGTYVDYMQLLEQGVRPDLLEKQFKAVSAISGGDRATMIERFRSMYGLNYTGAAQVWNMSQNMGEGSGQYTKEKMAEEIKAMQKDPEYQSDSTLLRDTLNKMSKNLANIGKVRFDDTEMEILKRQADHVADILAELRGEGPTREDMLNALPVALPEANNLRDATENGRALNALFTAPPTIEGKYNSLASVITRGLNDRNAGGIPEYYAHRAAVAKATGVNSPGGTAITSDELRELIPILRNLAEAVGKSDLLNGKSDEEIQIWLNG